MKFTKEELTIIERLIDNASADHCKGVAQQIQVLSKYEPAKKYLDKQFDSWVSAYDKLRTISAKCSRMKGEVK